MPRGQTLTSTLSLLKAELGYNLTASVATADDQQLYRLIDSEQKRLAADFDWTFLDKYVDVTATVGSGSLTLALPTTIVFERPVRVERKFNTLWQDIDHGISDCEYNVSDSAAGARNDPIQKWRMNSDGTFEVWPLPATQQTVRFHGQRVLNTLLTAGSYDGTKTLDLDDLLVIYYVAAKRLARTKQADATVMLQMAEDRLRMLRASMPSILERRIIIGGDSSDERPRRTVGMTVVVAP